MASEKVDLYVEQNSDFYQSFYLVDNGGNYIDPSGYEFFCEVRDIPSGEILATATITRQNNQGSTYTLFIPASQTATIPTTFQGNFHRYDIIMKNDTSKYIIFHGNLYVLDNITSA